MCVDELFDFEKSNEFLVLWQRPWKNMRIAATQIPFPLFTSSSCPNSTPSIPQFLLTKIHHIACLNRRRPVVNRPSRTPLLVCVSGATNHSRELSIERPSASPPRRQFQPPWRRDQPPLRVSVFASPPFTASRAPPTRRRPEPAPIVKPPTRLTRRPCCGPPGYDAFSMRLARSRRGEFRSPPCPPSFGEFELSMAFLFSPSFGNLGTSDFPSHVLDLLLSHREPQSSLVKESRDLSSTSDDENSPETAAAPSGHRYNASSVPSSDRTFDLTFEGGTFNPGLTAQNVSSTGTFNPDMEENNNKKDIAWKYSKRDPTNIHAFTCNFCGITYKGGVSRMKQHWVGGFANVLRCSKCPAEVRVEVKEYMEMKKKQTEHRRCVVDIDETVDLDDYDVEEEEIDPMKAPTPRNLSSSASTQGYNMKKAQFQFKRSKAKGANDCYFTPDVEVAVENRKSKGKQPRIDENSPYREELRKRAYEKIARFLYEAAVPLNVVNCPAFGPMIEAVGNYGSGLPPPTYYQVRGPLLKNEKEHVMKMMKEHELSRAQYGCTLMCDGWTEGLQVHPKVGSKQRATRTPANWWAAYGSDTPDLQKFAIKVLSLTCSSSGCERNWSVFEHIHSKKRNKLDHDRLNDLVFIKYNRALQRRYLMRGKIDPIALKDIDESNEWLVGAREEEYVFQNEDLTWDDVATAAGVEEPRNRTRSTGKKSASNASSSSFRLVDEDCEWNDDVINDDAEEEDVDGYKSNDDVAAVEELSLD
ncbi:hAT transposon superfamily [Striga asiatica]|uniref:HAT transposon superfamily n=1 Tax=Striga asiatica TaxID=4170 RepID=A0A5A7QEY3_STRAF|nr:hAT transposon superfamily [Striga asiatica]